MNFRLKELRKRHNISQIKLAIDLDTNQNTISRYENMERQADYDMLIRFADYFNVSLDYLLGRSDTPSAITSYTQNPDKKIMNNILNKKG